MKKVILGIAMIFAAATTIAFATKDKVPQIVKDSFSKKFPTVQKVDWEKENATEWEAEFKLDKVEYSANFLGDGTWKETEHKIEVSKVPQNVMASLKSNFPRYEIEEAELAETPNGNTYEFEIEKDDSEIEVIIDTNGKVLNKQSEETEEDND